MHPSSGGGAAGETRAKEATVALQRESARKEAKPKLEELVPAVGQQWTGCELAHCPFQCLPPRGRPHAKSPMWPCADCPPSAIACYAIVSILRPGGRARNAAIEGRKWKRLSSKRQVAERCPALDGEERFLCGNFQGGSPKKNIQRGKHSAWCTVFWVMRLTLFP